MRGRGLVLAAPAKVNLYLAVGEARDDGYHEVETVMQTVELHDTVTLAPAAALRVTCVPDVGVPPERNLATLAARGLAQRLERAPAFDIRVVKRIPSGGGLGGGSSDAAAVLAGLALAWDVDPHDPVLAEVAATLGADVPFFLTGGCALMGGRGDEMAWRLPTVPLHITLVNPGVPVATPRAYAAFDGWRSATPPRLGEILAAIDALDPAGVAAALYDNLTDPVTGLVPAVAEALAFVSERDGLLGSCMAGSGSTVFGVFAEAGHAEDAARIARDRGWWAEATRSRATGAAPLDADAGEESE